MMGIFVLLTMQFVNNFRTLVNSGVVSRIWSWIAFRRWVSLRVCHWFLLWRNIALVILCVPYLWGNSCATELDILDRTIERFDAIHTATIRFKLTESRGGIPKGTPRFILKAEDGLRVLVEAREFDEDTPAITNVLEREVVYGGSEWRSSIPGTERYKIFSNHESISFANFPSDDKDSFRLYLSPNDVTFEEENPNVAATLRCGSIPNEKIRSWLTSKGKSHLIENELTELNGVSCQFLKFRLDQADLIDIFFNQVPFYLFRGKDSYLQMYADPQHGYVVPKMEFVNSVGDACLSFESVDFIDIGSNIFFPKISLCKCKCYPNFFEKIYEFSAISAVNEVVDRSAFELDVPEGTRVICTLPGREARFVLATASTREDLEEKIKTFHKAPVQAEEIADPIIVKSNRVFWYLFIAINAILAFAYFTIRKSSNERNTDTRE